MSMSPIVGLLAAPALLLAASKQELTLQQVAKANTAAIKAIRSIHVTIEVDNNIQLPGEDPPPSEALPTYILEWFKDGDRERVRQNYVRGKGPHSFDGRNGPEGYKALHDYNPDMWPPLSESFAGRTGGEIDKMQTNEALAGNARAMSFIAPFPVNGGTLEDYLTKYPNSKLKSTPETSERGCYEIAAWDERPLMTGRGTDIRDVRVFIDPKVGFWIRRIEKGPWQKSTDPGDKGLNTMEVEEFKDCGNGTYWPKQGQISTRLPGKSLGLEVHVRHTLHSINQPVPKEAFEVRFPDWLRVTDRSTGQVLVWGPDDKPRKTFASQAEYMEWYKPRMQDPSLEMGGGGLAPHTRWGWLTGIAASVALLLFGLILWRRKATRTAGGAPPPA